MMTGLAEPSLEHLLSPSTVFCGGSSAGAPSLRGSGVRGRPRAGSPGHRPRLRRRTCGPDGNRGDAPRRPGGRVIGVIPEALATKEIARRATELHVVPGMHERKALMATRSTAFLTLPGGIGTFGEFFEI
ncbi:MAG: LOG family protein [Isosphaeraceae bacterium]